MSASLGVLVHFAVQMLLEDPAVEGRFWEPPFGQQMKPLKFIVALIMLGYRQRPVDPFLCGHKAS